MRALLRFIMVGLALGCSSLAPPYDAQELGGSPEQQASTVNVTRTRAQTLDSPDGVVRVTVPALSVEGNTSLVLARLRADLVTDPHIGEAYVLRVTTGALNAPARVEWHVGPDISIPTRDLRIATLGPDGNLRLLGGAQATTDAVAAEVDGAATLLLVDKATLAQELQVDLPIHSGGDALLWRADVEGARAAYNTARQQGPNPSAALGRALTDLLLLTKKAPFSDVLLRCGLPPDALLMALVGPGGVLAQAAEDRAGEFSLILADVAGRETLLGDEVYARRNGGRTSVTARGAGFELRVTLPRGEIALGQRLTRTQLPADVELIHGGDRFTWPVGAAGTITVFQRGAAQGGRVQLQVEGAELTGPPGSVTVELATMDDGVGVPPDVLASLGVSALEGPVLHPVVSRILGQCSADVTVSWLVGNAAPLSERLAPLAADLAEAAGATQATPLLMLPPGLTRLPRAIAINARDARLLGAAVGALRAGLLAAAAYEYAGLDEQLQPHPVGDWLTEGGTWWRHDGEGVMTSSPAVLLNHHLLSQELNTQVLLPRTDVDAVRAAWRVAFVPLEGALGDLRAAATDARSQDGMIRWTLLDLSGFSTRLRQLAQSAAESMQEGTSGILVSPGVGMNLSKLVTLPVTHTRLTDRNAGQPLTVPFDGAAYGRAPQSRNPAVLLNDHGVVDAVWESFLELAPATGTGVCSSADLSACGPAFACVPHAVGRCSDASGAGCAEDEGCAEGAVCVREHHCQRTTPAILDIEELEALWNGPQAPALGGWLWHLWQPVRGQDAARPSVPGR